MKTVWLLAARYEGLAVIPVETVCRDFFQHIDPNKFIRKVSAGELAIPLVRMEASQKAANGVHLQDLAAYLDRQREKAVKECRQLSGQR